MGWNQGWPLRTLVFAAFLACAVAIHRLSLWVLGVGHPDVAMVTAISVSVVAYRLLEQDLPHASCGLKAELPAKSVFGKLVEFSRDIVLREL